MRTILLVAIVFAFLRMVPAYSAEDQALPYDGAKYKNFQREKQLLYVSITRVRDDVLITWSGSRSEFLEEIPAVQKETAAVH